MKESILPHSPDPHHDLSSNTVFGFWIYLMTDFILFATLFAAYAVLHNNTFGGKAARELFHLPAILVQTLLLLVSIFTCAMAMSAARAHAKKRMIAAFGLTFLLGSLFLALIWIDIKDLILAGDRWSNNAFLSSYFTLVGVHAFHIILGLFFMILLPLQAVLKGFIPVVMRRLVSLKLFWFFSYLIWVFMFTIVYLIGVS